MILVINRLGILGALAYVFNPYLDTRNSRLFLRINLQNICKPKCLNLPINIYSNRTLQSIEQLTVNLSAILEAETPDRNLSVPVPPLGLRMTSTRVSRTQPPNQLAALAV